MKWFNKISGYIDPIRKEEDRRLRLLGNWIKKFRDRLSNNQIEGKAGAKAALVKMDQKFGDIEQWKWPLDLDELREELEDVGLLSFRRKKAIEKEILNQIEWTRGYIDSAEADEYPDPVEKSVINAGDDYEHIVGKQVWPASGTPADPPVTSDEYFEIVGKVADHFESRIEAERTKDDSQGMVEQ